MILARDDIARDALFVHRQGIATRHVLSSGKETQARQSRKERQQEVRRSCDFLSRNTWTAYESY